MKHVSLQICREHGTYIESQDFSGCPVCEKRPYEIPVNKYSNGDAKGLYAILYFHDLKSKSNSFMHVDVYHEEPIDSELPKQCALKYAVTGEFEPVSELFFTAVDESTTDYSFVEKLSQIVFDKSEIEYK